MFISFISVLSHFCWYFSSELCSPGTMFSYASLAEVKPYIMPPPVNGFVIAAESPQRKTPLDIMRLGGPTGIKPPYIFFTLAFCCERNFLNSGLALFLVAN